MNTPARFLAVAALLAGSALAQERAPAAGWLGNLSYQASGTARWVDNLSRTSYAPTRLDGETYELVLSATHHQQLAPSVLLHAGLELSLLDVPDFHLDNQLQAGVRVGAQRKFGLGPLAPVLSLDTAFTRSEARLGADRGWTTEAALSITKRLTPELRVGLRGNWLEHDARSQTFDLDQHGFSFEASWDVTDRWTLGGSAGRTSGDIVANAAWSVWSQALSGGFGPTVASYYNSRPWSVTDLYGPGWVSYNVEADVDLWSLAATYAATEHTSLELRYGSAFVVNRIGVRYPQTSWGLSLVHRF